MKSSGVESKDWKKTSEKRGQNLDIENSLKERINSRHQKNRTKKKWNKPRVILFINIVLLLVLLMLYQQRSNKTPEYSTTRMETQGIEFRLSIGTDQSTGDSLVSLTAVNNNDMPVSLSLKSGLANITFTYKNLPFLQKTICPDMKKLVLDKGEAKTFIEKAGADFFIERVMTDKKRNLLITNAGNSDIFQVECTLLFETPVRSTLTFRYEVLP